MRDGVSPDELADGLAHESGLLAIAGTNDAREIQRGVRDRDERAMLALAMFAGQVARTIAAAATALPSLDAVVFTGGIGTHAATIRAAILTRLAIVGLPVAAAMTDGDAVLASGPPAVVIVEAREDLIIGAEVEALLR
jgi:acetate kinase